VDLRVADRRSTSARAARTAVDWAAAEGWNPGLDDAERFLAADPDSFLATERSGEIVASVSCALYGDAYAFIGFYIVRAELRGQGVGLPLFERALARAGSRTAGLDAVVEQEATYGRSGFATSHRNVRWRTTGGGQRRDGLVELGSLPFDELLAFDTAVFGAERERFLRGWIDRPPGHALACSREGRLVGYGVLRPCRAGAKVGPLFADDAEAADTLLDGLLAAAGSGAAVFVDMPVANASAEELRSGRNWEAGFETARMYLNGRPPEDVDRVFGVTTLEFG